MLRAVQQRRGRMLWSAFATWIVGGRETSGDARWARRLVERDMAGTRGRIPGGAVCDGALIALGAQKLGKASGEITSDVTVPRERSMVLAERAAGRVLLGMTGIAPRPIGGTRRACLLVADGRSRGDAFDAQSLGTRVVSVVAR